MSKSNKKPNVDRKGSKDYLKYSGMAFQILAYLAIGVFLGKQLDKYFETSKSYFTAFLTIFFLAAFFVKLFYDLKKP